MVPFTCSDTHSFICLVSDLPTRPNLWRGVGIDYWWTLESHTMTNLYPETFILINLILFQYYLIPPRIRLLNTGIVFRFTSVSLCVLLRTLLSPSLTSLRRWWDPCVSWRSSVVLDLLSCSVWEGLSWFSSVKTVVELTPEDRRFWSSFM